MTVKELLKQLRYSLYIPLHPFKGFWDLKHEKEGSFFTAMFILALTVITEVATNIFNEQLFRTVWVNYYNPLETVLQILGIFFGFCISNWCFTCLNDGEGTLKEICTVVAYAMVPYLIVKLISIPLSYLVVLEESAIYYLVINAGTIWMAFLIVFGILVVHQYTFAKTLMVCFVTVIGMAVMAYIGILMLNLIQVMVSFFMTLFDEIRITLR